MVRLRSVPLLLSLTSLIAPLVIAAPALAQTTDAPPASPGESPPAAPETTEPAPPPAPPPLAEPTATAETAPAVPIQVAPPPEEPLPPSYNDYDGPPLLFSGNKKKKLDVGAYGSLGVAYTRMLDRDGALVSLEAALLIEHRLSIGLAGYGLSRTPRGPDAFDGTEREFRTGYGGLTLRYALFAPSFPVYASLGVLVGGGVLGLDTERGWDDDDWDDDDDDDDGRYRTEHIEGYFVTQPDITLHVNATRWLRFGITGGYRFASGVDAFGYDSSAMSGAVVGGNIQLGWF